MTHKNIITRAHMYCPLVPRRYLGTSERRGDQDVAFTTRRIKGTSETGGLEHDIKLRHLYTSDCTYVWPQYAVCAMAVRYGNTNRGCSRARRLYDVASRIAYSLLNIPQSVVGAALGTREIYFSRERNFKAGTPSTAANSVSIRVIESATYPEYQCSRSYVNGGAHTSMAFNANVTPQNAQSFKLVSNAIYCHV